MDEFASKTAVLWNVMIATNSHQRNGEEAFKLCVKMHHSGVKFDHLSFSGGLAASSNLVTLVEGPTDSQLNYEPWFWFRPAIANAAMGHVLKMLWYCRCTENTC